MTTNMILGASIALLTFIILLWQWVDIEPDAPTGEPEPKDEW